MSYAFLFICFLTAAIVLINGIIVIRKALIQAVKKKLFAAKPALTLFMASVMVLYLALDCFKE
jgi:hypothetical protein